MGPNEEAGKLSADEQAAEAEIALILERFPDWEVHRVFGGWEAVPRGTKIIRATYLDSLEEKLREA